MKILALEFSSPERSVAVVQPGNQPGLFAVAESVETGRQGLHPFAMMETVLKEAQIEREQIDCLAVGIGPGSYTGIRAAIALAQGWQLVRQVNLLGISTSECLAAQARAAQLFGEVAVVMDAQRQEFYLVNYEVTSETWRERIPLRLATGQEVMKSGPPGRLLVGPEVTKWFPGGRLLMPRASMLGRLAASRRDFVTGDKLEPIYLRETTFVKAK